MYTAKPRAIRAIWKEQWPLFALMLPGLLAFLLFCYVPFYGILMAFKNYNPLKGVWGSAWVGWANFTYIFALPSFTNALRNTVAIGALKLLFCYPLPIVFALMLNEIRLVRLKRTIQTISYLPHFISWVVAAGIWYRLLSPSSGIVNAILVATGILHEPINFVGEPNMFYGLLIFTDVWKELGWNAIIYLAAITSINPELYEAARVDGANRLQQVWHITLPGIKSTMLLMFIMAVSNLLNVGFDQIYNMMNDVVREVGDVLDTLIMRTLTVGSMRDMSLGTAMGILKNSVALLLFLLANGVSRGLFRESLL